MVQNVVADKAHSHRKNINFRVIRGFVFSNIADNEVSNLLGQFSITATVSAFIAGIIMTALSSVTLEELEYARDFCGYENDRGAYLVFVCVIGLASASSSLIASTGLYISLSSLNFGSSHALSDELLEIWFRRLEVFYFLSFSGLFVSIFCMVICLFYLGVIKYMNVCKNFTTGFVYAAIGVGFMVMIFLGSIYLVREHLILSTRIKTKLEDYFDGRELDEQEKKVVSTKLDTHIQWTSSIERVD